MKKFKRILTSLAAGAAYAIRNYNMSIKHYKHSTSINSFGIKDKINKFQKTTKPKAKSTRQQLVYNINKRLMSLNPRNLSYFLKHKIIYRRDPLNDQPTDSFDWGYWYEQGTYECYTLFASRAKINTYKSLKWHLYTLWYLNPQLDQDLFTSLAKIMCNKVNGFVTFDISEQLMQSMIYEVSLQDLDFAPKNKLRKIILVERSYLPLRSTSQCY